MAHNLLLMLLQAPVYLGYLFLILYNRLGVDFAARKALLELLVYHLGILGHVVLKAAVIVAYLARPARALVGIAAKRK